MKHLAAVLLSTSFLLASCGPETPKSPEEQAFSDANKKIQTFDQEFAFGNTPDAKKRAERFSTTMDTMQKQMFSGGGKVHGFTGGNFLTYCRATPKTVIFLCTVPGMKDYKGEVRDALASLAWAIAQKTASGYPADTTLVVALKGSLLYGPVWIGKVDGEPTAKESGRDAMVPFFPVFVDSSAKAPTATP